MKTNPLSLTRTYNIVVLAETYKNSKYYLLHYTAYRILCVLIIEQHTLHPCENK